MILMSIYICLSVGMASGIAKHIHTSSHETHERRQLDEIRTGGTVFVVFVYDFNPSRSHRCVEK